MQGSDQRESLSLSHTHARTRARAHVRARTRAHVFIPLVKETSTSLLRLPKFTSHACVLLSLTFGHTYNCCFHVIMALFLTEKVCLVQDLLYSVNQKLFNW